MKKYDNIFLCSNLCRYNRYSLYIKFFFVLVIVVFALIVFWAWMGKSLQSVPFSFNDINKIDTKFDTTKENIKSDEYFVQIQTAKDLFMLVDSEFIDKNFLLTQDIDLLTDMTWHEFVTDIENGWLALDTSNNTGIFDGGGFAITNLFSNRIGDVGLFSNNSLDIKNLTVQTSQYGVIGDTAGVLAANNSGRIDNVHISGIVEGNLAGGIIASNNFGDIDNCSFDGVVKGYNAGGIVGINQAAVIANTIALGTVKGHIIGGLAAQTDFAIPQSEKSTVEKSFVNIKLVLQNYDYTPTRVGGIIALRGEGVKIQNTYFIENGFPSVALGEVDGIKDITESQIANQNTFEGFDFDNYWSFDNNCLAQKIIAVSSNRVSINGIDIFAVGDKKYYKSQESATIKMNTQINFGFSAFSINGIDVSNQLVDNKYSLTIQNDRQINIRFEWQYLIKVQINPNIVYGRVYLYSSNEYFAQGQQIIIVAKSKIFYTNPKLIAKLAGQKILFEKISQSQGETKFVTTITNPIKNNAELFVDATFEKDGVAIALLVVVVLVVVLIVAIVLLLTAEKRRAKRAERK